MTRYLALVLMLFSVAPAWADESEEAAEEISDEAILGEAIFIDSEVVVPEPGTSAWKAETLAEQPGNQGDALRGLARVAGVARPGLGQREPGLSIWGTDARSSQVYVDDIPLPRLLHLGGYRSVVPSGNLHSISLVPGAASPRYGRVLGGVVDAHSARIGERPMRATASMDAFDGGMSMEGAVGQGTRVRVAARQSFIAQSFGAVAPASVEGLVPLPDTWDHQLLLEQRLSPNELLRVSWMGSVDHIERSVPGALETRPIEEVQSDAFQRLGVSLLTRRGAVERTVLAYAGLDRYRSDTSVLDVDTSDRRRARLLGLLVRETRELGGGLELLLGVDGQVQMSRYRREGALSLPAREGDVTVFGVGPGARVSADTWNITRSQLGLFAALEARLGSRWILEPGLRIEPGSYDGDRVFPVRATEPAVGYSELDVAVEPRLSLRFVASPSLTFFARAAQVHQPPDSGDLSPIFGSPRLLPARARQLLAGIEWMTTRGFRAEAMGLASYIDRLTARADSPTPALAELLTSEGEGRVWGGQLRVEAPLLASTFLQFAYTFMRSERRLNDEADWRAFDFDQPHRLRSALQWQSGPWALGSSFELVSGLPRTPVVDATFDASLQQFDPVFGKQNSERLPWFAQLSARAAYRQPNYRLWFEVVNLTNRSNVEERYYSSDFQSQRAIYGLPIMPFVGAELRL